MGLIFIDLKWYVWSWTLAFSAHKKTLMFNWRNMWLREKAVAVSHLNLSKSFRLWLNLNHWRDSNDIWCSHSWFPEDETYRVCRSPDFSSSTTRMLTSVVEIQTSPQLRDGLLWHFGTAVHGSQGMNEFNTPIKCFTASETSFPPNLWFPELVLFMVLQTLTEGWGQW